MNLEVIKVIAALCMVAAGDKNDYSSVVAQVTASQRECHAFYAECVLVKRKDFSACIIERKSKYEKDMAALTGKAAGK